MGAKRAVLVGINYPGTKAELKGCHNDVDRMRRSLVDRFGFDESDIRVLVDADGTGARSLPTGANIRRELARLVGDARPGDLLFFHYSGHGTRLPAETGQDDDTGYDECIVPCDMNLITDQDFTELVRKVPNGCLFTIVSDSCHSGGLLDKTKEQIGHSTKQNKTQHREAEEPVTTTSFRSLLKETVRDVFESQGIHIPHRSHRQSGHGDYGDEEPRDIEAESNPDVHIKNRSLPLSTLIEMLKDKTGKDDIDVGSIRMTLFHLFGDDASPKIKKFMKVMLGKLQQGQHGGVVGVVGALALEFLKAKLEGNPEEEMGKLQPAMDQDVDNVEEAYAGTTARVPSNGILISGCQTDQTSADATMPKGASFGALSNAIQAILAEHGTVTNKELVLKARKMLSKQGYTQQPGLYCSDEHAKLHQLLTSSQITAGETPISISPGHPGCHGDNTTATEQAETRSRRPASRRVASRKEMGRKRAVLVGINYRGADGGAELKGCHNDVSRMRRCLVDRFGFDEADIRVLVDADPAEEPQPTGANIRRELERLVADARPGDALFFHFSGHGLRSPAETGQGDDTGYDECIVPSDNNYIEDQYFKELVAKVPDGCLFTIVLDSCHSGGMVEKTKEQIGNSTMQNKIPHPEAQSSPRFGTSFLRLVHGVFESLGIHLPRRERQQNSQSQSSELNAKAQVAKGTTIKNRSLPLSTYIKMLKEKTGKDDVHVGSIRTTLSQHFGEEASPKVKEFVKVMAGKPGPGVDALKRASDHAARGVKDVYAGTPASVLVPRNGVLVSGCQTDQIAGDATKDGVSYGLLSDAIQTILAQKQGTVTNRELVLGARELLSKQAGFTQQPGLYCSDKHADAPFIC
ncbi:hypothetical protein EJB05_36213, partial [Eragrostis curvula]